ncbi:MAG: succinate dehydrogenase (or fumarate reductase) cytochrome b subunit, b558 family [Bacteroidetes bacterium]|nr:succinate dehydrogenase (or fumarate reductase) cytochrome b subunit, b558 family [Bacteroidota bacterium]MBS1234174.1 succinate dehydrogenase (or fumarate reductase) cytochrome b subunit, b558 family [Bacteroidota bacterium]
MSNIFASSIGKKLIMSLAGLFLILFLIVHLSINLSLIFSDSREIFNKAAHFMSSNILIKIFEVILFGGFILHMFYGLYLQIKNWFARGRRYRIENFSQTSFFSKFMIHTAVIIAVFLVLHLMDFYFKVKIVGDIPEVFYNGKSYHDLGLLVIEKFKIPGFVLFYLACFVFLAFHLLHGFWSAFQTLGLDHKVYTPIIKAAGILYTFLVVAGFMLIPVYIYFYM